MSRHLETAISAMARQPQNCLSEESARADFLDVLRRHRQHSGILDGQATCRGQLCHVAGGFNSASDQ